MLVRITATASAAVCFSAFMTDDARSRAPPQARDPELLDLLIEHTNSGVSLPAAPHRQPRTRRRFFQETWLRVLERGHNTTAMEI